jgi:hypothetical protein
MFDLGDPGDAHAHRGRDVSLGEAELLAGLRESVSAGLGQQRARADLDLFGGDPGRVDAPRQTEVTSSARE